MRTIKVIDTVPIRFIIDSRQRSSFHVNVNDIKILNQSAVIYGMFDKDELIAVCGLMRISLISDRYYIWILTSNAVKAIDIRSMYRFTKAVLKNVKCVGLVNACDDLGIRFARFFGFKQANTLKLANDGHIAYEGSL